LYRVPIFTFAFESRGAARDKIEDALRLRLALGVLLVHALCGAGREIVIFDTDSGAFGDDGAALVMLLRSPTQVNVQAVTVVPGNVWAAQGVEYIFHILDLLKRAAMPVYTGAGAPLLHTPEMAKESERRWGALAYTGAFAMDPSAMAPAPGSRLSIRKARRDASAFRAPRCGNG
jgi:hypothetical protein